MCYHESKYLNQLTFYLLSNSHAGALGAMIMVINP